MEMFAGMTLMQGLSAASTAMGVASSVMGVMGAQQQAQAQMQQAAMQNQAMQYQAEQQRMQAEQMRQQGVANMAAARQKADAVQSKKEYLLGKMRANAAASGFMGHEILGTLGVNLEEEGTMNELNELAHGKHQLATAEWGAKQKENDAAMSIWTGQQIQSQGAQQAQATVMGGIGSAFGSFATTMGTAFDRQLKLNDAKKGMDKFKQPSAGPSFTPLYNPNPG